MTATGDNSFARYSSSSRFAGRNAMSSVIETSSGPHYDIMQLFAAEIAVEIGGEVAPAAVGGALGEAGAVRRHQDIRQFVKRQTRAAALRVVRAPMLPPDIERGAAELLVAQCRVQSFLVDDRGAADIDQERARLHQ